jgi:hypothetical protein
MVRSNGHYTAGYYCSQRTEMPEMKDKIVVSRRKCKAFDE